MANNDRLLLLLSLIITIITTSPSFLEPDLSYAQTLGNIKNLSTDATDAHDPQVLVSESNIYVIWIDFVTGNDDIYFKRSTDGGASFDDTINLSNDTGDSTNPDIASTNDGSTYIVWRDSSEGRSKVFFRVIS